MVSTFGSLGYTIMGKTVDLTVVQKTIIDTVHKEGKQKIRILNKTNTKKLFSELLAFRKAC